LEYRIGSATCISLRFRAT